MDDDYSYEFEAYEDNYCYECQAYGDDYFINVDGVPECRCSECPYNESNWEDGYWIGDE